MAIFEDVFKLLDSFVQALELQKQKRKFKKNITKDQLAEVLALEQDMLKKIHEFLSAFNPKSMNILTQKYMNAKFPKDSRFVGYLIPDLKRLLTGRANQLEREMTFGSVKVAAERYLFILDEAIKNINQFFTEKEVTIDNIKISNMMVFGVFQEINMFNKYTSFLIENFSDGCSGIARNPMGYRVKFLQKYKEEYIAAINNAVNNSSLYSFLQDVNKIKSNNMDLILYADGVSGLPMLNPSAFNSQAKSKIRHGIKGFNVVASIADWWNDYRFNKYNENKSFKEWLEANRARLLYELSNTDPNSPEVNRLNKIIDAYNREIADYDAKLREFEEDM